MSRPLYQVFMYRIADSDFWRLAICNANAQKTYTALLERGNRMTDFYPTNITFSAVSKAAARAMLTRDVVQALQDQGWRQAGDNPFWWRLPAEVASPHELRSRRRLSVTSPSAERQEAPSRRSGS